MSPAELAQLESAHRMEFHFRRPAPKPDLRKTIDERVRRIRNGGRQVQVTNPWLGGELYIDPTRNEGVYTLEKNLPGGKLETYLRASNLHGPEVTCESFVLEAMARSYQAHASEVLKMFKSVTDPCFSDRVFAAEGYWKMRPFSRFFMLYQTIFFSIRRRLGALNSEGEWHKEPDEAYRKSNANADFLIFHQILSLT